MSSLCKELLLDYGMRKLPIEEMIDIQCALQKLPAFTKRILLLYIYGYTADEIVSKVNIANLSSLAVQELLQSAVKSIAEDLRIHDAQVIQFAKKKNYSSAKIPKLQLLLKEHVQDYTTHQVESRYMEEV